MHSLPDVQGIKSGSGDDAALSRLVPPKDEVSRGQELGESKLLFGLLVATHRKQDRKGGVTLRSALLGSKRNETAVE